jgi:hypothetical protein
MITIAAIWKAVTSPAGRIVLILLAFVAYSYFIYQEGRTNGSSSVINEQNKTDKEAIEDARDGRNDVVRCRARGLSWNRETGKCS